MPASPESVDTNCLTLAPVDAIVNMVQLITPIIRYTGPICAAPQDEHQCSKKAGRISGSATLLGFDYYLDLSLPYLLDESPVVAFVLVGVLRRKLTDRIVQGRARAHIA